MYYVHVYISTVSTSSSAYNVYHYYSLSLPPSLPLHVSPSPSLSLAPSSSQVMRNLHVVFTMNPSSEGLKDRAATSPALFNRCVLNWFGDWSTGALYQVGLELTNKVDLDKSDVRYDLDCSEFYVCALLTMYIHVHIYL